MRKNMKKVIAAIVSMVLLVATVVTPISASAAGTDISVKVTDHYSYSIAGYTITRNSFQTTDGRSLFCIEPKNTNVGAATFSQGGKIDSYSLGSALDRGSGSTPSASFIRSVLYYAKKYFGTTLTERNANMAVQLAIHKNPVDSYATSVERISFNQDSANPIAEIKSKVSGKSGTQIALSYASALAYKANKSPVSNSAANVTLTKNSGSAISGNRYIVAVCQASGNWDSLNFTLTGDSNAKLEKNGNTVTVYYDLSKVPTHINVDLIANVSKEQNEVYWYKSGSLQKLAMLSSTQNTASKSLHFMDPGVGTINIYKKDKESNANLSGAVFKITNKSTNTVTWKTTNANGEIKLNDMPFGIYKIEETTAPSGYYIGKDESGEKNVWDNITLGPANSSLTYTAYNLKQYGRITIKKQDVETGDTAQGDAVLNDGSYELFDDNFNLVETLTMNGSTEITSGKLPLGVYHVNEKKAPTGYKISDTSFHNVKLEAENQEVLIDLKSTTFQDSVIKGTIRIHKVGEKKNDFSGENIALSGVTFTVYNQRGEAVDTLTTDETGTAVSRPLPYGKYSIKETNVPEGYMACPDFELFIAEEKEYPFELTDDIYRSEIIIDKLDTSTNQLISVSNAKFKLEREDGTPVNYLGSNVFETQDGVINLPKPLNYGKYKLTEVVAPAGYMLDQTPIVFEVNKASAPQIILKHYNAPKKGKIKIHKTGLAFTGIEKIDYSYACKDDIILTDRCIPKFSESGLSGVSFSIIAAEDIVTADGTLRYKKDTIVDNLTTVNGSAISKELFLGKYTVVETAAPAGYKLNPEKYNVSITEGESDFASDVELQISNDRAKTKIELKKLAEAWKQNTNDNLISREIEEIYGKGFTFGLFAAEDIPTYDGQSVIKKDSLIVTGETDENGVLEFDSDLPFARYYLKELNVPDRKYNISEEKFPVDLTATGNDGNDGNLILSAIEEPILNTFDRFEMKIKKSDLTNSEPVEGAIIEIYDSENNILYREKTGADGYLPEIWLEPGTYTFKEIAAPEGYALNTTIFKFTVDEQGAVSGDTEIKDDITRYSVIKTDKNGNPLEGVVFGLFDKGGTLISEVITNEKGIAEFNGFGIGEFYIKETKPLPGYQKDTSIIAEIKNDGTYINENNFSTVKNYKITSSPKTGDNRPIFDILWAFTASGIAVALLSKKRRKR